VTRWTLLRVQDMRGTDHVIGECRKLENDLNQDLI